LPEPLSERVERLLTRARQPAISSLVGLELASVLARKVRTRELPRAAARAALAQFREHEQAALFQVLPVDGAHYARARRWIERFRTPLRTLDALHLAAAASAGCRMLTADVQLARAAQRLGVRRRLVREQPTARTR
jgi:predicted nucleic acid-binding protein